MDSPSRYRAVLIGIDDYPTAPLYGCVNDIDLIQELLLDRLGVPPERITRLTAPRPGDEASARLPSLDPTRDGIRDALVGLAGEVGEEDVVFLYYSGHGSQVDTTDDGRRVVREALVPLDFDREKPKRLLYDFELNPLFARIAERARDFTVVLDCCHSASAIRDDETGDGDRYLPITEVQDLSGMREGPDAHRDTAGLFSSRSGHLVVASCRASEKAKERNLPERGGRRHGVFTHFLARLVGEIGRPPQEILWSDLWPALLDRVSALSPMQHPQVCGRWERRVFGGPWDRKDPGYVVRPAAGGFQINAGTLMGLSEGAEVAVYGPEPDVFPSLGSEEDEQARLGLLRVEEAARSSCTAVSVPPGLHLSGPARGRLVKPGRADEPLIVLDPYSPGLAARLKEWGVRAEPETEDPEGFLRKGSGFFYLYDELHGDGRDSDRPALARIPAAREDLLERALRHWTRYNLALRLPRRCTDLAGALRIKLLTCRNLVASEALDAQDPDLPEAASGGDCTYQVREDEGYAMAVSNRSVYSLHTTLLDCTGSGRVEILAQAEIAPLSTHVFWKGDALKVPFLSTLGTVGTQVIDRLIAVGTTLPDQDLRYLELPNSFQEVLDPERDFNSMYRSTAGSPPPEMWTAEMITVRIVRPEFGFRTTGQPQNVMRGG